MDATEVVTECMAGLKPFEIRFMLNKMYQAGMIDYKTCWEGIEITMAMQERIK